MNPQDGKVFLAWSGEASRQVATLLHDLLPKIIRRSSPWMSETDIDSGVPWYSAIAQALEESRVGVICLTPGNLRAPWIHFEAGALSKIAGKSLVCPYLHGVSPAEVQGALSQFQVSKADKEGTRRLLHSINKALRGPKPKLGVFDRLFEMYWPDIQAGLERIDIETSPEDRPLGEVTGAHTELFERARSLQMSQETATPPAPVGLNSDYESETWEQRLERRGRQEERRREREEAAQSAATQSRYVSETWEDGQERRERREERRLEREQAALSAGGRFKVHDVLCRVEKLGRL